MEWAELKRRCVDFEKGRPMERKEYRPAFQKLKGFVPSIGGNAELLDKTPDQLMERLRAGEKLTL